MKKVIIILIGVLLLSMSFAAALPYALVKNEAKTTARNGAFEGSIGPRPHGNQTVGSFSGTYHLRNRGGRFIGNWTISLQNFSASGTMRGFFARHIILGRISVSQDNRTLPVIGFLRANNDTFAGRAMAPVGPALYFWGTYT